MKSSIIALLLLFGDQAATADIPASEVSLGGIEVGDSIDAVNRKLGPPISRSEQPDYLNLHHHYKDLIVSFSDGTVAGLFTRSRNVCTPKGLCVGDSLEKMQRLYGQPLTSDRESGKVYEYYGKDLYCWLQIPAAGKRIKSIAVACQP